MADKFTFDYETGRRFLTVKLWDVWAQDDLTGFMQKAARLSEQVRSTTSDGDKGGSILLDLSDFPVQQKEIAETLGAMLPLFGARAGRVAVVRSKSTLQHLQTQRVLVSDAMQTFDSVDDAMTWLFERGGNEAQSHERVASLK